MKNSNSMMGKRLVRKVSLICCAFCFCWQQQFYFFKYFFNVPLFDVHFRRRRRRTAFWRERGIEELKDDFRVLAHTSRHQLASLSYSITVTGHSMYHTGQCGTYFRQGWGDPERMGSSRKESVVRSLERQSSKAIILSCPGFCILFGP